MRTAGAAGRTARRLLVEDADNPLPGAPGAAPVAAQFKGCWVEGGCNLCLLVELCESGDLFTQLKIRAVRAKERKEQRKDGRKE
jgi:hypothetical protein